MTVILKASLEDRSLKHLDARNIYTFFTNWSGRAQYRSFAASSRIPADVQTFLSLLMARFCQDITQRQWKKTLSLTPSAFCRDTSLADGFSSALLSPARTYDNLDACEVVQSASLITAATLLEVSGPAVLLFPF